MKKSSGIKSCELSITSFSQEVKVANLGSCFEIKIPTSETNNLNHVFPHFKTRTLLLLL